MKFKRKTKKSNVDEDTLSEFMQAEMAHARLGVLYIFSKTEVDGKFAGCGALQVVWTDLAEIRSLAIDPDVQQRGLGKEIVDALIADAKELGIARVFAFTYVQGFFEKCGFEVVEHGSLPHKVFQDCLHCPKFNRCDEIAMARTLSEPVATSIPNPGGFAALPTRAKEVNESAATDS